MANLAMMGTLFCNLQISSPVKENESHPHRQEGANTINLVTRRIPCALFAPIASGIFNAERFREVLSRAPWSIYTFGGCVWTHMPAECSSANLGNRLASRVVSSNLNIWSVG